MIEFFIFIPFFLSIILLFAFLFRACNLFRFFIPSSDVLSFRHFLIPIIDLETIAPGEILETIESYREIRNPRYPVTDLSHEEIKKNYHSISIISLNHKLSDEPGSIGKILKDFNKSMIINKGLIFETNSLEKKLSVFLSNKFNNLKINFQGFTIFTILLITFFYFTVFFLNHIEFLFTNTGHSFFFFIILILFLLLCSTYFNFFYLKQVYGSENEKLYLIVDKLNDHFYPKFTGDLSSEIQSLESSLNTFNNSFKENLLRLEKIVNIQEKNLHSQELNLEVLKTLHPEKILETGTKVLTEMERGLKSLSSVSVDISTFGQFINSSSRFLEAIETLFDKTSDAELYLKKIANGISYRLEESGKLLDFLGSHLSTLEHRKEDMLSFIIATDNALKESYKELSSSEREILHGFQESTELAMDEYKKVMNKFLMDTSEISGAILKSLQNLDSSIAKIPQNNASTQPTSPGLEDFFFRIEEKIANFQLQHIDREERILSTILKSKDRVSQEALSKAESSNTLETDLNKLLTQINVNQMYFENILKELLTELRNESMQKKNVSEISYWKLTKAKWKKIRGEI